MRRKKLFLGMTQNNKYFLRNHHEHSSQFNRIHIHHKRYQTIYDNFVTMNNLRLLTNH